MSDLYGVGLYITATEFECLDVHIVGNYFVYGWMFVVRMLDCCIACPCVLDIGIEVVVRSEVIYVFCGL